jgi:hypothetical protein
MTVKTQQYKPGDWVWFYKPRHVVGRCPKWEKLFSGPFLVLKQIGPANYVIQRTPTAQIQIVHTDTLKAYYGITPTSWLQTIDENDNIEIPASLLASEEKNDQTEVRELLENEQPETDAQQTNETNQIKPNEI